MEETVRVDYEPADFGFLQEIFHALEISAFRQPDSAVAGGQTMAIMIAGDKDLCSNGGRMISEQRQQGMRRGASNDFELALFLKFSKSANEIASITKISVTNAS